MPFTFIDYTPLYFNAVAKSTVPSATSGKFVRIRNNEADYLVFSPLAFTKYHADIVERFCLDRGIEGVWDIEKKKYEIIVRSWAVEGGGKFEKDGKNNILRLRDNSLAFGKFDDRGLREAVNSLPDFLGYTVLIE